MSEPAVHACECPRCQQGEAHPDQAQHHQMNVFLSRLNEQQRRWCVALEAARQGDRLLGQISGMDLKTIQRGREGLAADLADRPVERVRQVGGGRSPIEKKTR